MYPLLETIAIIDSKIPYLACHQQRMDESFQKLFHRANRFQLEEMVRQISVSTSQCYKWRIEYGVNGFNATVELYKPRVISRIAFHEIPVDFEYSLKYSNRSLFEEVKHLHPSCEEVVLLKNGYLTDSLYANLVIELIGDRQLYTPATPLLVGTHLKRLLRAGAVKKKLFSMEDLSAVKTISFVNSMVEFVQAPSIEL